MAEKDDQLDETKDLSEADLQLIEMTLAGNQIVLVDTGPKVHVSKDGEVFKVEVNRQKFSDRNQAIRAATLRVAELTQTRRFIQQDAQAAFRVLQDQKGYKNILKLQGLKHLKRELPPTQVNPGDLGLADQFLYACEQYVIRGKLPEGLSPEVAKAFRAVPKSRRKLHALDELISEEYTPEVNLKLYGHLERAHLALKEEEKQETKKFEYKPQVGAGEQEPIDPNDIETKVSPFFGGYYRGNVCAYDSNQKQIVQKPGQAHTFAPDDLEEAKEYTYETVFNPDKDNLLELPYAAVPLPHTLEPKNLQIVRSDTGSFYLAAKQGSPKVTAKTPVTFKFILAQNEAIKLNDEPEEIEKVLGNFDNEAEGFLKNLEQDHTLSDIEKAKRCAAYVRKRFKYPKDEGARAQMNEAYLNSGDNLLQVMTTNGIADCYWSNIFHGQMLAHLGIHHRVIAGHYISKDPRFDFAAIAGIGHAWGEVWNGEEWIRTDATPAKEKEDDDDEEENGEPQDGDFGEAAPPEEQEELSLEEVRTLFEEMLEQAKGKEEDPNPAKLFEQQTGVSLAKWKAVEAFISGVNNTPVPAVSSIKNRTSTLKEEWDSLFEIIYKRREISVEAYRGPVRQSEGDELDDPVDAAIDLLAGEPDPLGYKIHAVKTREEIYVTEFEDDAILDLTGSMSGTPAEEQKKMILSGLYNLMMLNKRLDLDKYRKRMKDPINLRSHVLSFKGDTLVSVLQNPEQKIDEKALAFLYDELNKTQSGGGNLVGALKAYEAALDGKTDQKIKNGKCVKVLTIVSDGGVGDKPEAVNIITRLRARGIVVQGIGFGESAQDIRVICHDPGTPDAGVVLSDVKEAVLTRHRMLSNSLKRL
ncbi:MAG: transglutaminase domain-containing protein [Patescibacteria group bacterium]